MVLHHAALAYQSFLPTSPASTLAEYMHSVRAISPVNDQQRSMILSLIAFFNDRFLMSLMFFLSGLFVWKSLRSKGRSVFFRDRLIRLGLPFAVMVILAPLAYYTTYLQIGTNGGLSGYWHQWVSLGDWPSPGPGWFLWLLMVFDIIAILLYALIPTRSDFFDKITSGVLSRPALFFVFLVLISALAYIPMCTVCDPNWSWWVWGPFRFQTSRIFLYMVYFLVGVVLGAYGIERTLVTPNSTLARRWGIWVVVALAASLINLVALKGTNQILASVSFVVSCAASSFAFLAVFLRFARRRRKIFDSLSSNCYGIFVIHYGVVSWLLYAMLKAPLPAVAKGSIVFVCALMLCWGAVAVVRGIPGVARVL